MRVENDSVLTMVYRLRRNIQVDSGVPGEIGWTSRMVLNAWWRRESEEQTKGDLGVWGTNRVDNLHQRLKTWTQLGLNLWLSIFFFFLLERSRDCFHAQGSYLIPHPRFVNLLQDHEGFCCCCCFLRTSRGMSSILIWGYFLFWCASFRWINKCTILLCFQMWD